jgi:transposase
VAELPKLRAEVTEYQLHTLQCGACGVRTIGELPADAPVGQFGPRLCGLVAMLSGAYALSKRQVQQLLAEVHEIPLSLGSVSNIERRVSEAVEKAVDELREHVKHQPAVNIDETGWFEGANVGRKVRAWLWVVAHGVVSVFAIAFNRRGDVAKELLGDKFDGIVTSDRWSGYKWLTPERRQLCWAHLIRDFRSWAERAGPAMLVGQIILIKVQSLFKVWHEFRDGDISREQLRVRAEPIRAQILALLKMAECSSDSKMAGMAAEIRTAEHGLFTFIDVEGIEPTNNAAERALRRAVIWRKISFGTQSDAGSRFVERILTVVATARAQNIGLLDFLANSCSAHWRGADHQSLLPR